MRTLRKYTAFVPLAFFDALLPFNAKILDGNAMAVHACGAQSDGSIARSKEYLLFGHGLLTLAWKSKGLRHGASNEPGHVMMLTRKKNAHGVIYWKIEANPSQDRDSLGWHLAVEPAPDPDEHGHIVALVSQSGDPGQTFFLARHA